MINWKYIERAFVILLLGLAVAFGFKSSDKPWKNWEFAAVTATIIYAAVIYWKIFFDRDVAPRRAILSIPALMFIMWADWVSKNSGSTVVVMLLLSIGSSLFCLVDYLLMSGKSKYAASLKKTFKYSDLPVTLAFLILLAYSYSIKSNPKLTQTMEPFFGGAVAFQMMLSNFVWAFIDEPILAKVSVTSFNLSKHFE
jgi:hypothetical protein